jgi:hypothetical protein
MEYEEPVLIDLTLDSAKGYCAAGDTAKPDYCEAGTHAGLYCTAGTSDGAACTGGTIASDACTDVGVTAATGCTAGSGL